MPAAPHLCLFSVGPLSTPLCGHIGRAITQADGLRLLTLLSRVRVQVMSCRIYGGQSGTVAGFLRVIRFAP
jgi:hypothetical protein